MTVKISQNKFEWLFTFLVYNSTFYDEGKLKKTKENEKPEFIDGYFPMLKQTFHLISQIKNTVISPKIKVLIIELYYNSNTKKANYFIIESRKKAVFTRMQPISKFNGMHSKESLEKIIQYSKTKYKAKKNAIITYGHGSIFGINLNKDNLLEESTGFTYNYFKKKNFVFPPNLVAESIIQKNKEKTNVEQIQHNENEEILTNTELNNAIKNIYGNNKLDILIQYNCLMQNIYNQYELRETVDWFIAPQTGIGYPGFGFDFVLEELSNKLNATTEEIVKLVIESPLSAKFYSNTTNYPVQFKSLINDIWFINAVKLEKDKLDIIKQTFDIFVDKIISSSTKDKNQLHSILKHIDYNCINYSKDTLPFIKVNDLNVFLTMLTTNIDNNSILSHPIKLDLKNILNILISEISKISSINFIGNNFWKFNKQTTFYDETFTNDSFKGLGFLFPITEMNKTNFLDDIFMKNNTKNVLYPSFNIGSNVYILINELRKSSRRII